MAKGKYDSTDEYIKMVGRMIRAAGRRTATADPEQLALLISLQDSLKEAVQTAVDGMKESGFSWQSIGEATGTTRNAACMKWSKGIKFQPEQVA